MAQGRKICLIVVEVLLLVYTLSLVSSVNIGVSPASIKFEGVMRDGYAERYITVSADSEVPVEVDFESWGNISEWISMPNETLLVSKGNPEQIKISVRPPTDVPNGNYTGFVKLKTSSVSEVLEDHAVGKIQSSLDLAIFVTITDVELRDCEVKDIEISSAERGDPVLLTMNILNKGNVRINPTVLVDIWNKEQTNVLKSENFVGDFLMPTIDSDFEFEINSEHLDLGQYWAEIFVEDCVKDSLKTFDIVERGAMKSEGVLLNIMSKKEAKRGETILFEANFKNVGEKQVFAQFKGEVLREGEIVGLVESEKLDVGMGEVNPLQFYFTPENSGKYVVVGRVYYDNKRTFESTASILVDSSFSVMPIIYSLFVLMIVLLIYKLRASRKAYIRRMRELR